MNPSTNSGIKNLAQELFPDEYAWFLDQLDTMTTRWQQTNQTHVGLAEFSEKDVLLITYGDQFLPESEHQQPLQALRSFAERHLRNLFSFIHILPFFPSTSDDGFAVVDYRRVDPALGEWKPIREAARDFRMAFDLVLNHTSASHQWFQRFLAGEQPYSSYYLHRPAEYDTTPVVRPRTHPLLTPFTRHDGNSVNVWTTFSADQVDLDYSNPRVMLEIIDTLLFYVSQGAAMIRFDAIAYLWKEDGTSCIHHRNTHNTVKLFRALLEHLHLDTVILSETNVPHQENTSYFGDGTDEAHMVYNFALPPLTLHAFIDGTAIHLSQWASTLPDRSTNTTFLNFLASHDGIGVTPATGWLTEADLDHLVKAIVARGGMVSWKTTPEGDVPYELNVNYFSAVTNPSAPQALRVRCFLSSQAIMLVLSGVPGIYIHSLLGSENWTVGPQELGHNRAINRRKLPLAQVERELADSDSLRYAVFSGMRQLITARRREPCFAPTARQHVIQGGPDEVFALQRSCRGRVVLCLTNTAPHSVVWASQKVDIPNKPIRDLITERTVTPDRNGAIVIAPWETLWLEMKA